MNNLSNDQLQALNAISKLNDELSINDSVEYPQFSMSILNHMFFISYSIPSKNDFDPVELKIYNSEYDDRVYNDKTDSYQDFYTYLKNKTNSLIKYINQNKVK